MKELELKIFKSTYRNISLDRITKKLLVILGSILGIIALGILPSQYDQYFGNFWILEELKEVILGIIIAIGILLLVKFRNRIRLEGSLVLNEKQITERWKNEFNSIYFQDIRSIQYLYSNWPKDYITGEKERHWLKIKTDNKEFSYEFNGSQIQNALLGYLEVCKKNNISVDVETIHNENAP